MSEKPEVIALMRGYASKHAEHHNGMLLHNNDVSAYIAAYDDLRARLAAVKALGIWCVFGADGRRVVDREYRSRESAEHAARERYDVVRPDTAPHTVKQLAVLEEP